MRLADIRGQDATDAAEIYAFAQAVTVARRHGASMTSPAAYRYSTVDMHAGS